MPHYWIENSVSGADLGAFQADDKDDALDRLAEMEGRDSWADCRDDYRAELMESAAYEGTWAKFRKLNPIVQDAGDDLTIRCLEEDGDALAEFIQARTGLDPDDEDDGPAYRAVLDAVQSGMVSPSDEGMDSLVSDFRWWRADSGLIYATPACITESDARRVTLRWTGSMAGEAVLEIIDAELDKEF